MLNNCINLFTSYTYEKNQYKKSTQKSFLLYTADTAFLKMDPLKILHNFRKLFLYITIRILSISFRNCGSSLLNTPYRAFLQRVFWYVLYKSIYLFIHIVISPSFYLSIFLKINLFIYQYIYLFYLSIHLIGNLSIYLYIHLFIYPTNYVSIYPSIYLLIYVSIHLIIYPSIHLSIYLSIHISIYPSL